MTRKPRELKIRYENPEALQDPEKIRAFARWLLEWGIKEGTITPPWERSAEYDTQEKSEELCALRKEVSA